MLKNFSTYFFKETSDYANFFLKKEDIYDEIFLTNLRKAIQEKNPKKIKIWGFSDFDVYFIEKFTHRQISFISLYEIMKKEKNPLVEFFFITIYYE